VIAASAALSLALVTGAVAYIVSDDARQPAQQTEASNHDRSPGYEAHLGELISAFEAERIPLVDPNERYAVDVANALRDEEQRAQTAADAARRHAEERQRAEEARIAAETTRAAEAAAEAARVAAARAASAATPVAPAPTPAHTTVAEGTGAESTVARALTNTSSIQEAAAAAGWPADLLAKVERVVMCESSGRTTAVSPAGYVGLMQVAPWLHGPVPADAVGQLAQGYGVYLRQGWGAWPVCGR